MPRMIELMASSFSVTEMADSLLARTTLVAIRDVTRKLTALSSELGSHSSAAAVGSSVEQLAKADGKILAAGFADSGRSKMKVALARYLGQ